MTALTVSVLATTAGRAEALALSVRAALGRMDTSLTLAEAKAELGRHLTHQGRVWEAMARYEQAMFTEVSAPAPA